MISKEDDKGYHVMTNLLTPDKVQLLPRNKVEFRAPSTISSMPKGLINVLTKVEIEQLVAFLQSGGYKLPKHLEHHHQHGKHEEDEAKK